MGSLPYWFYQLINHHIGPTQNLLLIVFSIIMLKYGFLGLGLLPLLSHLNLHLPLRSLKKLDFINYENHLHIFWDSFKETQLCKRWNLPAFFQRFFQRNLTFTKHENHLIFHEIFSKTPYLLLCFCLRFLNFWFHVSLNATSKWQESLFFPINLPIYSSFAQVWWWWVHQRH